jgi:gamma-glutamylcysteine synthetase
MINVDDIPFLEMFNVFCYLKPYKKTEKVTC